VTGIAQQHLIEQGPTHHCQGGSRYQVPHNHLYYKWQKSFSCTQFHTTLQ